MNLNFKQNRLFVILILAILFSCKPEQKAIKYNKDGCEFCKMIITDHKYGCELVTVKAKVYKFDAIECLIDYIKKEELSKENISLILVTSYTSSDILIDAKKSTYLRSPKLPSPMGKFITAFGDKETAIIFQKENGGKIYSWDELVNNYKRLMSEKILDAQYEKDNPVPSCCSKSIINNLDSVKDNINNDSLDK